MEFDKTMSFKVEREENTKSKEILKEVYEALVEKGYNIYGKEMTLKEIKEKYGISQQLFNYRIKKGMSNEEAVEEEIKLGKRYDKR